MVSIKFQISFINMLHGSLDVFTKFEFNFRISCLFLETVGYANSRLCNNFRCVSLAARCTRGLDYIFPRISKFLHLRMKSIDGCVQKKLVVFSLGFKESAAYQKFPKRKHARQCSKKSGIELTCIRFATHTD